jgi:hypothetical protein
MTRDEAKFILSAYRPSGSDAQATPFEESLRMAGSDPELGVWLERSRAYDAAVGAKLREVAPPAGLRESILAGARATREVRSPVVRFSWVAGLAAAAVLTFAVLTMNGPASTAPSLSGFAGFAIDDTLHHEHGSMGEASSALKAELEAGPSAAATASRVDFERLKATGCRTLGFGGHDVLEVCFSRRGVQCHLYVWKVDGAVATQGPSFLDSAGMTAAAWSDGHFNFALVSNAGAEAIRRLL